MSYLCACAKSPDKDRPLVSCGDQKKKKWGRELGDLCRSASSCFLLFLYFRKVILEIFSELDETKAKIPILLSRRQSQRGDGEEPGCGHTMPRRCPLPRLGVVWAPRLPIDLALSPVNSHPREKPKYPSIHP
jgi:hypothetical protein